MATEAQVGSQTVSVAVTGDGTNAQARVASQTVAVAIEGNGTNAQARLASQTVIVVIEITAPPTGQFFPIQI